MINKLLYNNFCWNEEKEVIKILDTYNGIDVFYKNGKFFEFAISKGNVDVCKALVNYFENKQFPEKNREYEEAKGKLIEILENITSNMDISSEMQKVLSPYIDFEENIDIARLSDFDEFDFNIPISFKYEENKEVEIIGGTIESNNHIEHSNHTEIIS